MDEGDRYVTEADALLYLRHLSPRQRAEIVKKAGGAATEPAREEPNMKKKKPGTGSSSEELGPAKKRHKKKMSKKEEELHFEYNSSSPSGDEDTSSSGTDSSATSDESDTEMVVSQESTTTVEVHVDAIEVATEEVDEQTTAMETAPRDADGGEWTTVGFKKEGSAQKKLNRQRALALGTPPTPKATVTAQPPPPKSQQRTLKGARRRQQAARSVPKAAVNKKCPPIIVEGQGLSKALLARLRKEKVGFQQDPGYKSTRIQMDSKEDHAKVVTILDEMKTSFFTYDAEPASTISRILKRIPTEYTAEEVREEIKAATDISCDVGEMIGRSEKRGTRGKRLPMFRITATREEMPKILEADLFNTKAKNLLWEVPKRQPIIQCYRCQRFGHSSRNCHMPRRCVKCPLSHEVGECGNNDKSVAAYCVNCGVEGHPANYKKCPIYELALKRRDERAERESSLTSARKAAGRPQQGPSRTVTEDLSFAAALGNQQQRTEGTNQSKRAAPAEAGPGRKETTPGVSAQPLGSTLLGGTAICGIPIHEILAGSDGLVEQMKGLGEAERDFLLLRHFMELRLRFASCPK